MTDTRRKADALARAATTVRRACEARLSRQVDRDTATDLALAAWISGADHVEGYDPDDRRLPLTLKVAQQARDLIRNYSLPDGGDRRDAAADLRDAIVTGTGVHPCRVEVCGPREVAVVAVTDELDAWRVARHLADACIAGALTRDSDVRRWMMVEAYDDRHSPATWRVSIGPEDRTGKGR